MGSRQALIIGNSDGIGLALTRRLRAEGRQVLGVSRREGELTDLVADVTDPHFPGLLTEAVRGEVDVCVYAAGVGEPFALDNLAAQTQAVDVNLGGLARTIEAIVPLMAKAGTGHIIGLSSLADAFPSSQAPGYAASKAGMTAYLLGMRGALRSHGVAVSAIRFGFVDTKMAKAPSTPMMISVERAVEVTLRTMKTRSAVVSYPRRMSALARLAAPVVRASVRR